MNGKRGFSLLELLIVVAIILIIATIAIPSFLRSRQSANESAAVSNVRTINIEEATYSVSSGGNFGTLGALVAGGMLDVRFAGPVSGYNFTVTVSGLDYTVTATPVALNSGRYGYYSAPDGVIRYQTSTNANCSPCFPPGLSGTPVK
jgi:prepilin-type N-terminal cleavage/methylation domain-containing protein